MIICGHVSCDLKVEKKGRKVKGEKAYRMIESGLRK